MSLLRFSKENYFPHQWDFLTSDKPINALVAGFGSGKTFSFIHKTFYNMFKRVNKTGKSSGLILYPTYDLATELFVEPFCEMLEQY